MNWLKDFIRPKIKSIFRKKTSENDEKTLWEKCPSCTQIIYISELKENYFVCPQCDYHLRINALDRLNITFDNSEYENIKIKNVSFDPLKFVDSKKYKERFQEAKKISGDDEACRVAYGSIRGIMTTVVAHSFSFMGGSLGSYVGEAIVTAANKAIESHSPLIIFSSSGGARMQEGAFSLMQLPRTVVGIKKVKDAGLPYISCLCDPCYGGSSASYAMLGDIHIAEPGANIGFAGKRVIEQTIRETLPEKFQTAEYLFKKGYIDMVIHRKNMKEELFKILSLLLKKKI